MAETGEMSFKQIERYLGLLSGKTEEWIAGHIDKAEPYKGSRETIECLKKSDYIPIIVTDDALMSLPECNRIVKEKLGADKIIPTAEIEYDGEKICGGLKNKRTKPKIFEKLIAKYNPCRILCVAQGKNDYGMAAHARKVGGTVISVNSHSPELESVSDHHINSIAEAPKLLKKY